MGCINWLFFIFELFLFLLKVEYDGIVVSCFTLRHGSILNFLSWRYKTFHIISISTVRYNFYFFIICISISLTLANNMRSSPITCHTQTIPPDIILISSFPNFHLPQHPTPTCTNILINLINFLPEIQILILNFFSFHF